MKVELCIFTAAKNEMEHSRGSSSQMAFRVKNGLSRNLDSSSLDRLVAIHQSLVFLLFCQNVRYKKLPTDNQRENCQKLVKLFVQ